MYAWQYYLCFKWLFRNLLVLQLLNSFVITNQLFINQKLTVMKNYLMFIFAAFIILTYSCKEKVDIGKEKEAIKAVIEQEKDGYFEKDINKIESTWVQDATARKIYLIPDEYSYFNGWSEVNLHDRENLNSQASDSLNLTFDDFEFNIYRNTALVFCNTKWSGIYEGNEFEGVQHRILHFIKVNGQWKYDLMAMDKVSNL